MPVNYQMSFDDYQLQQYVNGLPGRVAYIDESGSYGFDFDSDGVSKFYVLCAIVVENSELGVLHTQFREIKKNNGLANTELKSSGINDRQRERIMNQVMPLHFRIVLFIADKQKFREGSPLTEYKPVFIKNMAQHMYNLLYQAYPKLSIIQDETGYPEFQESFKKYVEAHRHQLNIFNQYDFDMVNSKDEALVQLADFIGGSIHKRLNDPNYKDYLEQLKGKITKVEYFPNAHEPYWGQGKPEDYKYNSTIFAMALKYARDFIGKYETDVNEDHKMQVELLRYLLNCVTQEDPTKYVYADELVEHLAEIVHHRVTKNTLFRRVIAPLRDEGVILASCPKGYKIPISEEDLIMYLNSTTSTVGPMMQRMGRCRELIKRGTDNELDLFNDPAFIRYKRYFDEEI